MLVELSAEQRARMRTLIAEEIVKSHRLQNAKTGFWSEDYQKQKLRVDEDIMREIYDELEG